jgi:FkbM family methyltransferase
MDRSARTHARNINLLFQEVYEVERILPSLIDKDTVFVDVGAYMGLYTVYACRRVRRVLAIEPNPMALAYLKANVALNNCHNTIVVPKAVSDKRGVVKLRIPKSARKEHVPTTASIVWSFEEALEIDVETDTLDNIVDEAGLDTVDFVKIDVEGAEGLVINKGG